MATTQKLLRLDVSTDQSFIYLKCKQYDESSRIYQVVFTDRNKPIQLNGNEFIMVSMIRNDNSYADTSCVWDKGKIFFTMTEGMLSIAGESIMEFRIYSSNSEILSTVKIHVLIENSLIPQEKMVVSDEFNVLNNLILQAFNLPVVNIVKGNIKLSVPADTTIREIISPSLTNGFILGTVSVWSDSDNVIPYVKKINDTNFSISAKNFNVSTEEICVYYSALAVKE